MKFLLYDRFSKVKLKSKNKTQVNANDDKNNKHFFLGLMKTVKVEAIVPLLSEECYT